MVLASSLLNQKWMNGDFSECCPATLSIDYKKSFNEYLGTQNNYNLNVLPVMIQY